MIPIRRMEDDEMFMGPPWFDPMLKASYFVPCAIHGDANKSECNLFCLNCMGNAFCSHCLINHRDHHVVQIRRFSDHNVVRVNEIQKYINISSVQTDIINSDTIVFLNGGPQRRRRKGVTNTCEICCRSILAYFRFCSLGCKASSWHKKEKSVAKNESNQEPKDKLPFSVERDTNASSKQRAAVKEEMPEGEEWHAKVISLTDCKPVPPESPDYPFMEGSFKHKEKIVAKDESDQEPEDKLPFSVERDTNASSKQRAAVKEEMPEGEEWQSKAISLTDCKPVLSESLPECPSYLFMKEKIVFFETYEGVELPTFGQNPMPRRAVTTRPHRGSQHKEKIVAKDETESDQEPEDKFLFSFETDTNASSKQGGAVLKEIPEGEEWHAKAIFSTDCKRVLPESPNCPFLGSLSLEGCKALRTIPSSFFNQMPVLKYLNLSHTSIRSLPVSLFKLDSLENLILRCCKLFMELSSQIGQLHNLMELDLDDTQIVGLPKEIRMLSNLKILKLSLDECLICGKQLRQNVLIHPGTIKSLFMLTELKIDVNPDSKGWNAVEEVVVEEACSLKSLKSLTLYLPHVQILGRRRTGNTSLNFYPLSSFRFTVGQHRQRIFSRVPKNVEAEFEKWNKCLKFVRGSDISSEMKRVVGYTKAFYLKHHTSARSLCDFGIENMKNLKFCLLAECNKIQTIIDDGKPHEEEQTGMVEGEATNCESYSAQEPALLNLQFLHIYYLEHLESIWSAPTYDKQCLSALKFLELHTCPKLEVILSPTLLTNLGKLEVLIVKNCPELISVVSRESNASFKFASDCFLPSLKMMLLLFLPKLESISREFHIAPKLEMIGFYDCSELRYLCKRELSSENLAVIKGEREWWKALKWEKAEWGNHFVYLHYLRTIFSPIDEDKHVMTQMEETYKAINGIPYPGLGPTP